MMRASCRQPTPTPERTHTQPPDHRSDPAPTVPTPLPPPCCRPGLPSPPLPLTKGLPSPAGLPVAPAPRHDERSPERCAVDLRKHPRTLLLPTSSSLRPAGRGHGRLHAPCPRDPLSENRCHKPA